MFWHSGFGHGGATPGFDAAALFDVVFVCDPELVLRYRNALGHHRVDVLRFAAQPRLHNPVQDLIGRVHDVAHAGPRCCVAKLTALCRTGVHIFADGELRDWPPELVPYIVGRFTDTDLSTAATMYKVFLAMDERQALELSACATPIVSGGSAAIRDTFGALVPTGETDTGCFNLVQHLLNSPELRARQGHLAMREVHDRHLTTHRVDRILAAVGLPVARRSGPISVLASTRRVERVDHVIGSVARHTMLRLPGREGPPWGPFGTPARSWGFSNELPGDVGRALVDPDESPGACMAVWGARTGCAGVQDGRGARRSLRWASSSSSTRVSMGLPGSHSIVTVKRLRMSSRLLPSW